jgi:hypothetical protein
MMKSGAGYVEFVIRSYSDDRVEMEQRLFASDKKPRSRYKEHKIYHELQFHTLMQYQRTPYS